MAAATVAWMALAAREAAGWAAVAGAAREAAAAAAAREGAAASEEAVARSA